ncbi:MAG TPA: hypothetical protein VE988_11660 [Gemmataceae bacterium]|nr:hypothetical protein [Gemmataceae bacterium]
MDVVEISQTFVQLIWTLLTLIVEIAALGVRHALLLAWVAWWLWGVDWNKAWAVLAKGGWAVVVLLTIVAALVWASISPSSLDILDLVTLGNFWWQLGAVTVIVLVALLCGWVQGVMGWAPAEINLEPPVHAHADHHGHH